MAGGPGEPCHESWEIGRKTLGQAMNHKTDTEWGPQDSVQLQNKWLYGRYNSS